MLKIKAENLVIKIIPLVTGDYLLTKFAFIYPKRSLKRKNIWVGQTFMYPHSIMWGQL